MTPEEWHERVQDRGFGYRWEDDGDPHVYIKTTWLSIAVTAAALVGVGALLF